MNAPAVTIHAVRDFVCQRFINRTSSMKQIRKDLPQGAVCKK